METRGKKRKRVGFHGAEVIEYDAERPAVVHLGGAKKAWALKNDTLENKARGLDETAEDKLEQAYVDELTEWLSNRGLTALPLASDESKVPYLRRQTHLADLLFTSAELLAAFSDAEEHQENRLEAKKLVQDSIDAWVARDEYVDKLHQLHLLKKQVDGQEDESYAFGRRFISIEAYLESMEEDELVALATDKGVHIPGLEGKQRTQFRVPDSELVGTLGMAVGKPLKKLTLRELVLEAQARGLNVFRANDKTSKKKKIWVDALKPVMREEIRDFKIREARETVLRMVLTPVLEEQMKHQQVKNVVALVDETLRREDAMADKVESSLEDELQSRFTQLFHLERRAT